MTRTFNTRMVFRTMGALLLIEAVFMTLALGVSLWYGEADSDVFLLSTIVTLLAGILGLLIGRRAESRMGEREGYVIVAMVWVVFSAFGLLPYYLSTSADKCLVSQTHGLRACRASPLRERPLSPTWK